MKGIEESINLMSAINEMKGKDGEMREKGLNDDEIKQVNNFEFNLDNYPALKKMKDLMQRMDNLNKK